MKNRSNHISLKNVRYKIRDKVILNDISLDFPGCKLTGVIGNNGSGKTTLLRLILGAIPLTSGTIHIQDRALASFSKKELARTISILSQNLFVEFAFPSREVVLMGRNPHRSRFQSFTTADYEIVEEKMRLTKTSEFMERLITELSGGEGQTVFLARALTQNPQFLLLDEPTSHLDIYHQIRILELVKSLTEKIGVVLVVHDLNIAARFCDRLVLMSKGKIVAQGRPEEVLTTAHIEQVFNIRSVIRYDESVQSVQLTFLHNGSHQETAAEIGSQEG